jgi:hypothetical protein
MKRFFSNRYGQKGTDHDNMGTLALKLSVVVISFTTFVSYRTWKRTENNKKMLEQQYKPVDPNDIVPHAEDIPQVNHEKLQRLVLEGNKFILEELGVNIISSPEEYVYHTTKGIKDKIAFLKFLRTEFDKLPKETIKTKQGV